MEVATKEWANQIREIKIRELKELIAFKQEIVNSITNLNDIAVLTRRHELVLEICRLKDKLEILCTKK